jgi:hypothetical protein
MDDLFFNIKYGFYHVLDINGYDHVLFIVLLAAPYLFNNWKRLLGLVSMFTIGHTLALFLAVYGVVTIKGSLVEFLIPVTIIITGLYNIIVNKGLLTSKVSLVFVSTLFFGLVHGLGFAREFKLFIGRSEEIVGPLIQFAFGIEFAQVSITIAAVLLAFIFQVIFNVSKRDWIIVSSSIVLGVTLPILKENFYW